MPCGESGLVSGSVSARFGVVASGRFLLSMAPAKRRCLGCRKSFTPDRRTATRQTMCSRGCGAKHRRTQSKVRREADVVGFREDERERQRACRARRVGGEVSAAKAVTASTRDVSARDVSRAEWAAKVVEITDKLALKLDRAAAASRAEWKLEMARITEACAAFSGEASA